LLVDEKMTVGRAQTIAIGHKENLISFFNIFVAHEVSIECVSASLSIRGLLHRVLRPGADNEILVDR
jgi:hypothetical protein